jgi:hypothetical protein
MTCTSEYSFACLSSERDYHWLWIILPIILLIFCLLYTLSRPNYARLSSRAYQLITPSNNVNRLHPQKQQNYGFNQHAKYSTPTSSSRIVFEQCKERTTQKNNSLLRTDKTIHKTSACIYRIEVQTVHIIINYFVFCKF